MDTRTSSSKRPASSSAAERHQRQKREKYTLVACNDCKRRKIKCTGGSVCQRCQNLGLRCIYTTNATPAPTTRASSSSLEGMEAKFAALEKQLNQLQSVVAAQQYATSPLYRACASSEIPKESELDIELLVRREKPIESPCFIGPTNSLYSLDVGKSSLRTMGVQPETEQVVEEPPSVINKARTSSHAQPRSETLLYDTLLCMGKDEALRLVSVYAEELDPIYPFLDLAKVANHLELLLDRLKVPLPVYRARPDPKIPGFDIRDSEILMLVLASALIIEGLGQSEVAEYMVDAVELSRNRRAKTRPADLKEVLILTIMSVYYFHCDEEILAWRTIGEASRAALEMGLHRKDSIMKSVPNEGERAWAIRSFWCVYILDRRWALGTGLPCAINQSDIDPNLPEPDDSSPYLQRLIAYASLSSKVSNLVNNLESVSAKSRKDQIGYLDFQIDQWLGAIPPDLQMSRSSDTGPQTQPRSTHRLRVLLYVRANHLKILIHRHSLLSATSIIENLPEAKGVIETSKDTIQVLADLNRTTDIYQTQQACFNYFLLAPLAALFLGVCHGPTYFVESCRSEFYMALDLVKAFSSKSCVSRRLWNTIRVLKKLGPQLGVTPLAADENEQVAKEDNQVDCSAVSIQGQPRMWNGNTTEPDGNDLQWIAPYDLSDISNQMTCDLEGLYKVVAEGNVLGGPSMSNSMMDGEGIEQIDGFFQNYPTADVSKVLESLF